MKRYILAIAALLITSGLFAQQKTKSPDILFEEKTIDFGTIDEGDIQTITYKFYNSGTAPLLIKNVKPSCGCTAEDYPKHPIMPGQSGTIKASFDSKGTGGQNVSKSLFVTTNIKDGNRDKTEVLIFKGSVRKR